MASVHSVTVRSVVLWVIEADAVRLMDQFPWMDFARLDTVEVLEDGTEVFAFQVSAPFPSWTLDLESISKVITLRKEHFTPA